MHKPNLLFLFKEHAFIVYLLLKTIRNHSKVKAYQCLSIFFSNKKSRQNEERDGPFSIERGRTKI